MFKKILPFLCILLGLFFFCSCKAEPQIPNADIFEPNAFYQIGFKEENLQTRGQFHFDENGTLHFLHEDPTSPLFGMEEVKEADCIKTYFNGMEYENYTYFGGINVLLDSLDTIKNTKPTNTAEKEEEIVYRYDAEDLALELVLSKSSRKPIRITGTKNDKNFSINFSPKA